MVRNRILYNESDVEIHENGVSVKGTFFDKKGIVDVFNELVLTNKFIEDMK